MSREFVDFGAGNMVEVPDAKLIPGTKIYLAGPLGFAESTRYFHHQTIELVKQMGGIPLDPWTLTPDHIIQQAKKLGDSPQAKEVWRRVNTVIAMNNHAAISESSGILADLDGIDVDSGTAAEIGAASVIGKVILGYRGDFRIIGDNPGAIVNLQVQHYIERNGGEIVRAIKELPWALLRHWGDHRLAPDKTHD